MLSRLTVHVWLQVCICVSTGRSSCESVSGATWIYWLGYYFTRTITVTNSLTSTITNKTNIMTTLNYTWQKTTFTKHTALCRRKHRLTSFNTWLPPTISQERLQWRIHWHQLLQTKQTEWRLWTIRDKRPLLQSIQHFADENTDWLWTIRDCSLVSGI